MMDMDSWCSRLESSVVSVLATCDGDHLDASKVFSACECMEKDLVKDSGVSEKESKTEVKSAIEIVLRRLVQTRKVQGGPGLVDLAIGMVEDDQGRFADPELVFLVLEELFQVEVVGNFEQAWGILEQRIKVLTSERFLPSDKMTKSKMVMLRIANFMLRRLSAARHTVLCGRVMMFLAYAFPLSERSGVNLLGTFNETNVTDIEDEESFEKVQREASLDLADQDGNNGEAINYVLYQKFWQLQKFFRFKVDKAPQGCASGPKNWGLFLEVADAVLNAFESKPFSKADLDREMAFWRQNKRRRLSMDATMTDAESQEQKDAARFFSIKYLSSSRLLKLQLSDPTLRRNVLVQFAFLINTLSGKGDSTNLNVPDAVRVQLEDEKIGLGPLQSRVYKLLEGTPPDGESFVRDLKNVLTREENWLRWKSRRCPNFERMEEFEEDEDQDENEEESRKRAKDAQAARIRKRVQQNRSLWKSGLDTWKEDLAKEELKPTPTCSEFIKDMEIAIDPENCIEDEYHPKNDPIYCWRGLRLLSRENFDIMEKSNAGDLEKSVKELTGFSDEKIEAIKAKMKEQEEQINVDDDETMENKFNLDEVDKEEEQEQDNEEEDKNEK